MATEPGPQRVEDDGEPEAIRLGSLDKLKNELAAAVVMAGGIMLGTGWLLTWARLSSEGLPSESILTALPSSYYLQVALRATLAPFLILVSFGAGWVVLDVWRVRRRRGSKPGDAEVDHDATADPLPRRAEWRRYVTWGVIAWGLFGAATALVSWLSAIWLNPASSRGGTAYVLWTLLVAVVVVALAMTAGGWIHHRRLPAIVTTSHWPIARPVVAATIVLCFVAGASLRIADARFARGGLPVGQVFVKTPCVKLTGGRVPAEPARSAARETSPGERCQVGGFYLGETGKWILLVKRPNPCPGHEKERQFLLSLPREDVQELAVYPDTSVNCRDLDRPRP